MVADKERTIKLQSILHFPPLIHASVYICIHSWVFLISRIKTKSRGWGESIVSQ